MAKTKEGRQFAKAMKEPEKEPSGHVGIAMINSYKACPCGCCRPPCVTITATDTIRFTTREQIEQFIEMLRIQAERVLP